MRILIVNKYHYLRGGDCAHVFALAKLLTKFGHEVRHFSMNHPLNIKYKYEKDFVSHIDYPEEFKKKGINSKINVFKRILYSKEARNKFKKVLNDFKPNVIHFHNIHKHLTTSILFEANKQKIPVIWTLHDYNLICPNILFVSKGSICEKCKKFKHLAPIINKCSNNSVFASGIISIEKLLHDFQGIKNRINYFLSPSHFLKNKFSEYGFSNKKIIVIPNFYECSKQNVLKKTINNKYFLYLGRISVEKGIGTLCEAAKIANIKLLIAGTGPIKNELEQKYSSDNIKFVGYYSGKKLSNLRKKAWFLVIPSECYENNPFSVIESFSDSVPVIGADIGGIPELVKNNNTGFLFESKDVMQLSKILLKTNNISVQKRNELGKNGKKQIQINNNPKTYYDKLLKVYKKSIKEENKKWKH
jgi:glycosyltransferase involved in cell wall biosynthesis